MKFFTKEAAKIQEGSRDRAREGKSAAIYAGRKFLKKGIRAGASTLSPPRSQAAAGTSFGAQTVFHGFCLRIV